VYVGQGHCWGGHHLAGDRVAGSNLVIFHGPASVSVNLAGVVNMDPQIRRWLIALAIAITLFAIGMAMSILHLI
jgi:hypothetical protein